VEVCGDRETQYRESETCNIPFLSKNGDRTPHWSGDDTLKEYKSMHDIIRQAGTEVTLQTCIQEVPGLNLVQDTGYRDLDF
jgi:hypothetical protein